MGASYAAAALPVRLLGAAGLPARREIASEVVPGGVGAARAVVGISQSGRSPETIAAVGAWPAERRWSLTNVAGSALAEVAGPRAVDLGSEPDSYASTIGYTGTLIGLTMLARTTSGASVDAAHAEWHGIDTAVRRLEEAAAPVIAVVADLATHPASGTPAIAADVVASGASRAASESGALLLREVCRVPSSAVVTRNYLHGEMESAGGTLHVVLGADREVRLARSLAAAGHPTLLLTSADAVTRRRRPAARRAAARGHRARARGPRDRPAAGARGDARGPARGSHRGLRLRARRHQGQRARRMTLVVGIDVGGTKTHLRVDDDGTTLVDLVVPSEGWPPRSAERAARWLAPHIDAAVARARAPSALPALRHCRFCRHGRLCRSCRRRRARL